jgi:hypothetical protein
MVPNLHQIAQSAPKHHTIVIEIEIKHTGERHTMDPNEFNGTPLDGIFDEHRWVIRFQCYDSPIVKIIE